MRAPRSLAVSIAFGWVTGAALYGAMAATHWYASKDSSWEPPLITVIVAFAAVGPGFVAGYFAARSGFVVGATAGVLTSIVNAIFVAQIETRSILERAELPMPAVPEEIAFALAALIVGGVCGLAGVKVAIDTARKE